ncbi:MAG: FAD-binding oxidoreductase [Acidimicrobiia bacterium]|nr:FAD-binding oxidoreductase [Acidimicrobiia bacterium]
MSRESVITEQPGDDVLLAGWGGTAPTRARLASPLTEADARQLLDRAPDRGAIARGLGRAYGDAAQNAGGLVLDATALSGIIDADLDRGIVTARAGTSLDELMRWLIPRGWFLVTPGTRFVTVGGAIASDIHGKGHHVDGTFGNKVRSFRLLTGSGEVLDVDRESSPEVFWATTGGMGLTGVLLDATFELIPTETRFIRVDEERCPDLDAMFSAMEESDSAYRYSVAWIDCGATGKHLGRGILGRGNHATLDEVPKTKRSLAHRFDPHQLAVAPPILPSGLINAWTVKAFNELWYRKTRVSHRDLIQDIGLFFHPLDMIDEWSRVYGSRGFVQYQFVVPFGAEDTVRRIIEILGNENWPSFLAVLKRFGAANPGMLSFPMPGWTLTVDIPVGRAELARTFDRFDEMVLQVGGRVYLAKDARTRPENLGRMYPRLPEWREVRHRLDPDHRIASDLSRRLGL